jgi:hypothetical protein
MENQACPNLRLIIPFQTVKNAEIAFNSLSVDKEPKRSHVTKSMSVEDNKLVV